MGISGCVLCILNTWYTFPAACTLPPAMGQRWGRLYIVNSIHYSCPLFVDSTRVGVDHLYFAGFPLPFMREITYYDAIYKRADSQKSGELSLKNVRVGLCVQFSFVRVFFSRGSKSS